MVFKNETLNYGILFYQKPVILTYLLTYSMGQSLP
jgi:hypothetical protein